MSKVYENITLSSITRAKGALFNNEYNEGESSPAMTGIIKVDDKELPISGFVRPLQDGKGAFLMLALGAEGNTHYKGAMFRNSNKTNSNSADYYGYIYIEPVVKGEKKGKEFWENAESLKLSGTAEAGQNKPYISLTICPRTVEKGELAI